MSEISKAVAMEIAIMWETDADDVRSHPERRATLRECADLLRMMVDREPLECPRAPPPFRYCPDCDPDNCAMRRSHP